MAAASGPGEGLGTAFARLRSSSSSLVSSGSGVVEGRSRGQEISGRLPSMLLFTGCDDEIFVEGGLESSFVGFKTDSSVL